MDYRSCAQKIRKNQDVIIEALLFLALGFLVGFTIKTEASRRLTIGFDDYTIRDSRQGYDLEAIKKAFNERAVNGTQQGGDNPVQADPDQVSP